MSRLAICLFTHDGRRDVLAEGLAAIVRQIDRPGFEDIEVCVTDNASSDGTQEMLESLRAEQGERVRYLRHERDLGLSRNLLSCVELARSEYCWIVTSDDLLEDGAIARVVRLIDDAHEPTGVVVGKANFDRSLTRLAAQGGADFYPPEQERTLQYKDADEFLRDCGLLISLVSTLVVRRDAWLAALATLGGEPHADTTIFPHLPIVRAMAQADPRWVWCPAKLVRARMGNAFQARDKGWGTDTIHMRLLSDLTEMWKRDLGSKSDVRAALLRRAYRSFATPEMLTLTAPEGRSLAQRAALLREYSAIFWRVDEFWWRTLPFLVLGRPIAGLIPGLPARGHTAQARRALSAQERLTRVEVLDAPAELPSSHETTLRVAIENLAPTPLWRDPPLRVVVGYQWHETAGALVFQGPAFDLPADIGVGRKRTLSLPVLTPLEPGTYTLRVMLAQEDVGWFDDHTPGLPCSVEISVRRFGWDVGSLGGGLAASQKPTLGTSARPSPPA